MAHAILMPRPGQMTEECTVIAWHKREGDPVHRGDVLFEIETDKSTMEVEAFDEGVLLRIVAPEGATVPVNAVCAWVGEAGEAVPDHGPAIAVAAPAAAGSPAAAESRAAGLPEAGPAG
ncbi:MAG: biotin/lipoyl-containing protein, partial [Chloroflexota bacterium]